MTSRDQQEESVKDILKSGIYIGMRGNEKDLIYETSDKYFFMWLNQNRFRALNANPNKPLTTLERYIALNEFLKINKKLGRFRIDSDEWEEFEYRMKDIEGIINNNI